MNYLAHALPFLKEPYVVAGTGVPDWLSVADRQVRVRGRRAESLLEDANPVMASVARGVAQHLRDDARFHETRAFAETSLRLTVQIRNALGDDDTGFRPSFLGHLLIEVLLDASLAAEDPRRLEAYYQALDSVDAGLVQRAVNHMLPQPTERLAPMIAAFREHRILWDYLQDDTLLLRLNQVMRRVAFDPLPDCVADLLPDARQLVAARRRELLHR